jgi:hypothetical protein
MRLFRLVLLGALVGCEESSSNPSDGSVLDGPTRDGSTVVDGSVRAVDGGVDGRVDGPVSAKPSAPSNLLMTAQTASTTSLFWEAATAGSFPIDHYRIYRNGDAYDTAATVYVYAVAAVDTHGNEGPQATQDTVYGYRGATNGSTWGSSDYSYGLVSLDWSDTTGAPIGGGTDIKMVLHDGTGGGFQP